MEACLTVDTIAEAIGITKRAASIRAKKEGWSKVRRRIRGGYRHLFPASMLPDYVRAKVFSSTSEGAKTGFARGIKVNAEVVAARKAKEAGLATYGTLSKEQQAEADAKAYMLQARDGFLAATKMTKKKGSLLFIKEVKAGTIELPPEVVKGLRPRKGKLPLSWSSFHRWETDYREYGRAGLACQYASKPKTTVPEHMHEFIQAILVDRPHIKIPSLRNALTGRFLGQDIPSQSSLRRYADKWRKENDNLILYITDFDQWRSLHMSGAGNASERADALNSIWEFDSTPADVMLTDGRHTLIGVIDVYSRRVKLMVSPTSKAESVAALTRNAILDWGVPEVAKTDNGADYVSKHMVRVFEDLNIWQELCPPFTPEKKPHIERVFKTYSHSLVELLPGYIGHSVADRKSIESRKSFAKRMMEKDSVVEISLSSSDLQTICDRWVNAVYHHDPHSSLGGKTPAQMAREWTGTVMTITDERALDVLLNPAPDRNGLRLIGKKGVQIENFHYNADEFAGHEGHDVFVLMDRSDISSVYVFTADTPRQFICKAVNMDLPNVDRAEIASKRKNYQKKYYQKASKELRKTIRKQSIKNVFNEYLDYRESEVANIVEMPKPSEPYTTPALEEAALAVEDVTRKAIGPVPIGISDAEEERAKDVIRLADKQAGRALPSSPWEKYEFLSQDLASDKDLTDAELAWMKRYEIYLETGKEAQGI